MTRPGVGDFARPTGQNIVQTTIYGFINGQLEVIQAEGGATPYERRGRISDGNSRIGFSGSMGMRPEIKGIWQIEAGLNSFEQGGVNDNGQSATLSSRNTFVGVAHARLGQIVIGNNDSVYRSLVGSGSLIGGNLGMTVHGVDVWNNTSAQLSGNADSIFSRGEARFKNSVHYLSPELYGVQLGASYGFDESQTGRANRARYALAAKYSVGDLKLGLGYDHQDNTGVDTERLQTGLGFITDAQPGLKTSYAKLVVSYQLAAATTLGLGVEQGSFGYSQAAVPTPGNFYTGLRTGTMHQRAAIVTLAQDVGDASLLFGMGKLGKLNDAIFRTPSDFSATQLSLGATYRLDQYFTPYIYFTRIHNQAQANINLGQAALRSNNLGSSNAYLAPGDSPRAIGIGLLARF